VAVRGGASAGGGFWSPLARAQYSALARMRLQMLLNSLRLSGGKFNLAARIFRTVFFSLFGLLIAAGLGAGAFSMTRDNQLRLLSLLFWAVMMLWQFTPVVLASFQGPVDLSLLLRFPVSFGSYLLEYLVFGLFDASSILGGLCLVGIWTGISLAQPALALWAAVAALLFAAFNVLLTRMIFAWIDRWLAQRRTREVLGIVFLFLLLGAQLLNPALYGPHGQPSQKTLGTMLHAARTAEKVQRFLPPGLAAGAIEASRKTQAAAATGTLAGLAVYGLAAGSLLAIRLRAEYRGENLGEAPRVGVKPQGRKRVFHLGWDLAGPIGAVVEKEFRYLGRSGVMLYSLLAPLIMLFVLGRGGHNGGVERFALPLGAAYGFLGLTRLVYNSLGGEGSGIQLYFMSPTPFRTVMLAKNVVQFLLFLFELAVVVGIVVSRFGLPDAQTLLLTASWLLFALPLQLAAGNLLSINMAYRMTLTRMSREQGAAGNGLLSLLIQLLIVGVGAGVYFSLQYVGRGEMAAWVFLSLAAIAGAVWFRVLARADGMAMRRRDSLIESVVRAA
jgi:ABC-2 type transport system permease protein